MLKKYARRAILLGLTALVLYLLSPAIMAILDAWPRVKDLQPWWLAAMALAQAAAMWCLWKLQAISIGTNDLFSVATSQLAGGALGRVIPGGAATATATQFGMITSSADDVDRSSLATGLAIATILQVASLCLLPLLALPAILFGLHVPQRFWQTGILGLMIFAGMALLALLANNSEPVLRWMGRTVHRLGHYVPRWNPPANLPDRLVAQRDAVRARLGERLTAAAGAALGRWLCDFLTLVAAVLAVGGHASLWLVLLAFFSVQLLSQITITPGGIGVVEVGLGGALVIAGLGGGQAAIATLAYRLFSYWLMMPAGFIAWVAHRHRLRLAGREEFDPSTLWMTARDRGASEPEAKPEPPQPASTSS